jgi:hypothetical protein
MGASKAKRFGFTTNFLFPQDLTLWTFLSLVLMPIPRREGGLALAGSAELPSSVTLIHLPPVSDSPCRFTGIGLSMASYRTPFVHPDHTSLIALDRPSLSSLAPRSPAWVAIPAGTHLLSLSLLPRRPPQLDDNLARASPLQVSLREYL